MNNALTNDEIENRFRYHPPKTESRAKRHARVSQLLEDAAKELAALCPQSRGLANAITKLEEARMWANQAVACSSPTDD